MRNINTTVEHYSEILEDDITISLSVDYEITITGGGDVDEDESEQANFIKEDVTILNRDIRTDVAKEFFEYFDNYTEEITNTIETELNN